MSNRSKIKYAPFDSLVGFRDMINNETMSRNDKIIKPNFGEYELDIINDLLRDSYQNRKNIYITYIKNNKLCCEFAYVTNVLPNQICLSNKKQIPFECLYSVNI